MALLLKIGNLYQSPTEFVKNRRFTFRFSIQFYANQELIFVRKINGYADWPANFENKKRT